jgi:cytochrome P450
MLKRPETYQKLKEEIRSSFNSEEEMTVTVLGGLKYLNACLEEGLRIYPPAPSMHPRIAPRDGGIVCGLFIPEGVS